MALPETHEAPTSDVETTPMALLKVGVPLTLLLDLTTATPDSQEICEAEGGNADWLVRS